MNNSSEMLQCANAIAEKKINNPLLKTIVLAYLGGMFIAIGGFASTIASFTIDNYSIAKLLQAATFPIGLILIIICGGEMFTGNCLIFFGVLNKKVAVSRLIKNLAIVFIGNIVGALTVSALIYFGGLLGQNQLAEYSLNIAANKASMSAAHIFVRGILCNILVCLAIWGAYAAKEAVGKVLIAYFTVFTFILTGTEHCVANLYYFWTGFFASLICGNADGFTLFNTVKNLSLSAAGNFIGAAFFICVLYRYVCHEERVSSMADG